MSLNALLHTASSAVESIAPALANHLWQSTVFAAVAGLLTLALRRNQARIRYSLWLAASLKFLIPFSLLVVLGSHLQRPHASTPQAAAVYVAMEQVSQPFPDLPIFVSSQNAPDTPTLSRTETLELSLAGLWLAGSIFFLLRWLLRWRQMSLVMRQAIPTSQGREFDLLRQLVETLALNTRITLLLSPSPLGPGVYGIARPKLIWPSGISLRLDDAHLKTVMAHELCHVRRRDNLTAALHMLVETIFWFHPLVWWLGARLIDERERACDESVMEITGQPRIYAESILKICEFYVEPPLACVSSVTGADLKKRLVDILDRHAILKLSRAKIALLTAAGLVTIAVPILSGQAKAMQRLSALMETSPNRLIPSSFIAPASIEQSADTKPETPEKAEPGTPTPSYEVASVRPSAPNPAMIRFQPTPDGMTIDAMTLKSLIAAAYNVRAGSIYGGPEWVSSQQFDINAKVGNKEMEEIAKLPLQEQYGRSTLMLQQLLESRFNLKIRRETKEMPTYALVVTKGGAKLTRSPPMEPGPDGTMPPEGSGESSMSDGRHIFKRYSMEAFAMQLGRWPEIGRSVMDQTGLKGIYDFEWKWKPSPDDSGSSLFTVLEDQLGLKLESRKGPVETLVIESVDKPSLDGAELLEPPPAALRPVAFAQEKPTPPTTPAANAPYVPSLTFDVASIHESKPEEVHRRGGGYGAHSELMILNMPVLWLVKMAYGVNTRDISGQPGWAGQTDFVVNAKSDAAADQRLATLSKEQVSLERQHMVQTLLADRFQLKMHWETREADVYNLVLAKGGSKLQPPGSMKPSPGERWPGDSKTPPPMHQQGDRTLGFEFYGHDFPIEGLGQLMSSMFGRDVVNKTGLTGGFDFHIQYLGTRARDRKDDDTNPLPTFEDAMQDQLGLKLEPAKGPVQVLVIDHIEKPSPN